MKSKLLFLFIAFFLSFSCSHTQDNKLADKGNGEFVTISGKITKVSADAFLLKYNDNKIVVEMDDYGWAADGYKLAVGDQVVVAGRIDNDFLESKKIEAGSVYVKSLNTFFYANDADEEDLSYINTMYSVINTIPEDAAVSVTGWITSVDDREFLVDTGERVVNIDTKGMVYNPLDNIGYVQLDVGDKVRLTGKVDRNYFENAEVDASYIAEL